ncbi:MAG: DUF4340 domain-containing protein, partial [Candidatus Tectomicrobia bacterium]|nr:DUF4340 domain-containing protein [Candidatus Tectomicrobia bacterium]
MNPRKNLALLLILAVAGGAYYLYDVKWASEKREREERTLKVLKGIDTKSLMRISVDRKEEPYQMIRTEKGWRFVKPVDAAVDEEAIERLLKAAAAMKEEKRVGSGAGIAEFGLNNPYLKLTFGFKGQDDVVLSLGDLTPTREFRYASVKDGGVFTLPLNDYSPFNHRVFNMRDRSIVNLDAEKVKKIVVEPRGKTPFTVVRQDKDTWELTAPIQDRADSVESEGIASILRWEKAHRFVEEDPKDLAKYGLAPARQVVQLYTDLKAKPADGLLLGDSTVLEEEEQGKKVKKTYYYGRRLSGGPVFLVSEKVNQDIPADPFKVRRKVMVDYDVDHITRLKIETPEETVDVRRLDKRKWEIGLTPAGGKEAKLEGRHKHIDDVMWDIKWANAVEFVDAPGEDLDKYGLAGKGALRRVTVWLKKKKDGPEEKKSFVLGPLRGGKAYGRLDGEKRLFAFGERDVQKILRTGFYLSERRLVRVEKLEDIARIEVRFPDGREAAVRRAGDNWVMERPAGKPANEGRVGEFLGIADEIESQGVAPAGETGDFEAYRVRLSLMDKAGKTWGPI